MSGRELELTSGGSGGGLSRQHGKGFPPPEEKEGLIPHSEEFTCVTCRSPPALLQPPNSALWRQSATGCSQGILPADIYDVRKALSWACSQFQHRL